MDDIIMEMAQSSERGKPHFILIVAEGATPTAQDICDTLATIRPGFESRLTVLGHVQRGGSPTAADRLLATKLGAGAVEALTAVESGVMVGIQAGRPVSFPLEHVLSESRPAEEELLRLEEMIAL
jgi:6-phosphofructokinase 1